MAGQSLYPLLPKIRAEWRASLRLRIGVYVLLGIFWLYGILLLKDVATAEQSVWETMESKIARAKSTAAAADWSIRAQEVKLATAALETLLWREGSIGLSQASFEERISQSLSQSGVMLRSSIRSSTPADGAGIAGQLGLIELRARVQTDFRVAALYPWLSAMNRQKFDKGPTVFVESLIIRAASFGQPATVEMELVGYAIKASKLSANTPSINPPAAGAPK
jgi:hypothetical protein